MAATTTKPQVAVGGTLFGNPVSMAAARATMAEVLTAEAYAHSQRLGGRLADGLEALVDEGGLAMDGAPVLAAQRIHVRAAMPRTAARPVACLDVAAATADAGLPRQPWGVGGHRRCRADLLGRATDDDVDRYLAAMGELIDELG